MKVAVALDSGAYSIYQKQAFKKTKRWQKNKTKTRGGPATIDYSFYSTPEFDAYLEAYVDFLKKYRQLEFYVTIDAINEPTLSWDIFKRIEKAGLKPLPVWHAGEEIKWLKKYLGCTDYVGFGGMGTGWVRQNYVGWAREGFRYIGKDIKVHGFAMTSLPLVRDLPWYSVDSSTPFYMARCGTLLIPAKLRQCNDESKFDFLKPHSHVAITERRKTDNHHSWNAGRHELKNTEEYLQSLGTSLISAQTDPHVRGVANFYRMHMLERAINEKRPFKYYMSGASHDGWETYVDDCERIGVTNINFLGTYFATKPTTDLLTFLKGRKDKTPPTQRSSHEIAGTRC